VARLGFGSGAPAIGRAKSSDCAIRVRLAIGRFSRLCSIIGWVFLRTLCAQKTGLVEKRRGLTDCTSDRITIHGPESGSEKGRVYSTRLPLPPVPSGIAGHWWPRFVLGKAAVCDAVRPSLQCWSCTGRPSREAGWHVPLASDLMNLKLNLRCTTLRCVPPAANSWNIPVACTNVADSLPQCHPKSPFVQFLLHILS
jgi:hypothetical protein